MRHSPILTVALTLLLVGSLCGQPGPSAKKEPRYKGKTISYWVQELQSEQEPRRLEAKHALRAFGNKAEAAVPALKMMLEDLSPDFRAFGVMTLNEMAPLAKKAVPELVELLKEEKNTELRRVAADTLGKIGPDAAAALPALRDMVAALEHPSNRAGFLEREQLLVVMTQIGPEAALPLADLLDKEDADLRQHVLLAFEALGPKAGKAADKLEPLLKDSNAWVRFVTARALWKISQHKDVVQTYARLLDDQDLTLRTEVAWTLGKMGADAKEALPALQKHLQEADRRNTDPRFDRFRATALNAMFRIDPEARNQEPPLHNDTADKDKKPAEDKKIPDPPPPPVTERPTTLPPSTPQAPEAPKQQSRNDVFQFYNSFFH